MNTLNILKQVNNNKKAIIIDFTNYTYNHKKEVLKLMKANNYKYVKSTYGYEVKKVFFKVA